MNSKNIFLYSIVIFGWSTSWLPMKGQVGFVAPEVSILWRFLIATGLCFLISKYYSLNLSFSLKIHLKMASMGVLLFSSNFILFYYASFNLTSGLLAVIWSLSSVINIIMVAILTQERPQGIQLFASLVGITGLIFIFFPEVRGSSLALPSLVLCLIGTISFCAGNMVSASLQKGGVPVLSANSWGMLYGSCFLFILAVFQGHEFLIESEYKYITGLIWLSVVSSVLTFTCYLTLIGQIGAGRAGYATVIFPVFALLISTFFENYTWTQNSILGLALILTGNIIMVKSSSKHY